MKKLLLRYILAVMMIITSVLFGVQINTESKPPINKPHESRENVSARLVLRYFDGTVSLFEGEQIIETFSQVNISLLPFEDMQELCDGIEISSIDDAYRLIEDFDG